jgi:hypothetical protein
MIGKIPTCWKIPSVGIGKRREKIPLWWEISLSGRKKVFRCMDHLGLRHPSYMRGFYLPLFSQCILQLSIFAQTLGMARQSFHHSANHAHPHLFLSLSGQEGNQVSTLAFRLCVLHVVHVAGKMRQIMCQVSGSPAASCLHLQGQNCHSRVSVEGYSADFQN